MADTVPAAVDRTPDLDLDGIRARQDDAELVAGDGAWEMRLGYDVVRDAVAYEVHAQGLGAQSFLISTIAEELAEFIAHARADVPALLAEVDRLRAQRDATLALHAPTTTLPLYFSGDTGLRTVCSVCSTPPPCSTRRALGETGP